MSKKGKNLKKYLFILMIKSNTFIQLQQNIAKGKVMKMLYEKKVELKW